VRAQGDADDLPSAGAGRGSSSEPVVDRALALLAAFRADRRALTLSELSRLAGLPTSTAHRLAGRLVEWGALERRADGRYVVGLRLLEVASLAPRGHGLRELAMPYLGDLAEATHQHVMLAVLEEDEAMLVERLSYRTAAPVHYRVGGRMPLHSTGVGLVLLTHADEELQERVLASRPVHLPEGVPVDVADLRRQLAKVRRDGIAQWRRASPTPVFSLAAPIWDTTDRCCAALSVLVPSAAENPARGLTPALRAAARAVSRALGSPRASRRPNTTADD
jgi:DNA-binding IclR family transcriptional regulator